MLRAHGRAGGAYFLDMIHGSCSDVYTQTAIADVGVAATSVVSAILLAAAFGVGGACLAVAAFGPHRDRKETLWAARHGVTSSCPSYGAPRRIFERAWWQCGRPYEEAAGATHEPPNPPQGPG